MPDLSQPAVRSGTRGCEWKRRRKGTLMVLKGAVDADGPPVAWRLGVNEPTLRNW